MTTGTKDNWDSRFFWTALSVVVLFSIATRFYHLGYESLWLDEAITFARSRLDVTKLVDNSVRRYHNPSYFLLIHYVMAFGDSEFVLRAPSAVAGVVKTLAVYGLGFVVGGKRLGLLAAALLVLSPSQLKYDQEARMYGVLGLSSALTLLSLFWLLSNNATASTRLFGIPNTTREARNRSRYAWITYCLAASTALYLHNTAVLFVGTCAVALFGGWFESKNRRQFALNWSLAHTSIAVCFLPWLPTLLRQNDRMQEKGWWAVEPDAKAALNTLTDLYGIGSTAPWVVLLLGGLALFGITQLRKRRATVTALVLLSIGGPVTLAAITLFQPMFMLRLMLWSAVPYTVLVAHGILSLRPKLLSRTVIGVTLTYGLMCLHWGYYEIRQKPNWQSAVELLVREVASEDVILATGGAEARSLYYYLNREYRRLPALTIAFDIDKMANDVQPFLKGTPASIWTIQARERPQTIRISEQLSKVAKRVSSYQFGPQLVVERYQPLTTAPHGI
jgi:4-amino-4-deoxy-L-arabinose transferase-like glycosyltransferase